MSTKQCRGPCEEIRPLNRYRRNRRSKDGRESVCKLCRSDQDRIQKLRKRYGLTLDDFRRMREAQEGRCAICRRRPKRLQVDHCHDTGAIRGLLCGKCNRALGLLKDNTTNTLRAALYLARNDREEHEKRDPTGEAQGESCPFS